MNPHDYAEALLRELAPPRRNQFFYGKRMDVQHFRMEQDYGRLKQTLLNRLTLGKGVVCGLRVAMDGQRLTVDPGVAIDGLGREIVVPVRSLVEPASDAATYADSKDSAPSGLFTLWVCYRECSADYQPVLVSDCDTREQCAAGTTVESFCFKVTPGLAPLQGDPLWCVQPQRDSKDPQPTQQTGGGADPLLAAARAHNLPNVDAVRDALSSRRRALCKATSAACDFDQGDPCVPLAALLLSDGRPLRVDSCLVRPRIYSNAVLLDLILCLAQRVDECCKDAGAAPLMQVAAVDFVHRGPDGETVVTSVASPLTPIELPINGNTNAIRVRFTKPFAQDAHAPTTPGSDDANFQRHNVLVLPEEPLQGIRYVPGALAIEAPDTLRFDLLTGSPYSRGPQRGWQKGRYRLLVCGTQDAPSGRPALTDLSGVALDGEPRAPANGAISGDGTAAGDFSITFTVG